MQNNIVKKMLMVMALSTSMAFGASTTQFDELGNNSSTKVKSSKKIRKHNNHSNVQSLASQFESGAVNNASNSLIKDPIVSASTPVADTVSQLNSSNTIKGPTANISDLVPVNAQDSSVFSAAPTPSTSELVGLSGAPAANQDSSLVVPAQSPLPLDTPLTVPASNNLMPSDQNAMPALDLNSAPQELAKPLVSAGDLSNDSFGQGSGVFSSNDSMASTVVAPQSQEAVRAPSSLPLDTSLTVPASNNLMPSDQNAMTALDLNNDTTPATPFPSPALTPVLSGIDPVADQLVQHQESVAANTAAQLDQHQDAVAANTADQLAQHQEAVAANTAAQLDQHQEAVAANTAAQLDQHQEVVAANTAAQLDQHQESVAANTAAQLDQHQEAVAANTAAQLDQHQEVVAANTAAQLDQHQGIMADQLARHHETLLSAIKDSANSAPVAEVDQPVVPVSEVPVVSAPVAEVDQPVVPATVVKDPEVELPKLPAEIMESIENSAKKSIGFSEVPVVSAPVSEDAQTIVPVSEVPLVPAPVAEDAQTIVPVSEVPLVPAPVAEVNQPVVPVVSAPVSEDAQSIVTVVPAPISEVNQPVVPAPVVKDPVVELPKLPAEIMERIENAAKKSIELKGIVGGKADKDMLQAELATVKAANDLQIAKAGKNVANTIDNISKRLTELLRLPEAECVKELEAIVAELKAIESEIYPDNHAQIADSMYHNSIEADSHIGAENLPFADGDYQSEYDMNNQR